jgi:hypothetical protein
MPRKKTERGERKFEELRKGRASWRPGEAHPLDRLFEECDQLRQQLPEQLVQLQQVAQQTEERLRALLEATQAGDALFTSADHAAHQAIVERFHNRKHYSHLHAHLTIQRYRRLLGRLQAIGVKFKNNWLMADFGESSSVVAQGEGVSFQRKVGYQAQEDR